MKKSHGPTFKKAVIELAQCPLCRGRAVTKGLFHELPCAHCNASGWVAAGTGEALALAELVTQLSLKLQAAHRQIEQFKSQQASGPEATYQGSNRRGAGGTNYTGD
jgi:reverse gyrase